MRALLVVAVLTGCRKHVEPHPDPTPPVVASAAPSSSAAPLPEPAKHYECRDGRLVEGYGVGGLGLIGTGPGGGAPEPIGLGSIGGFGGAPPTTKNVIASIEGRVRHTTGMLNDAGASSATCAQFAAMKACVERVRHGKPSLDGSAELEVEIDSGVARKTTVITDRLADPAVVTCVREALAAAKLERGSGTIAYTVNVKTAPGNPVTMSDSLETTGNLPREVVRRIVRTNSSRFRACYDAAAVKDPRVAGNLTVKFLINQSGGVGNVTLDPKSSVPPTVSACATAVFRTLSFPEPDSGVVIGTYSIDFKVTPS